MHDVASSPDGARLRRWKPALTAIIAIAAATAVQTALKDVYGEIFAWVTYCFGVFAAALYGGLRPALWALALGYLAATFLFVSPRTIGISGKDDVTAFLVYLAFGLFAGFVAESLHRSRKRAEEAARITREQSQRLHESDQRFRFALASGAVTAFEQDLDLRYVWVFPQDPAFSKENIGHTDAELLPRDEGSELTQLKQDVIRTGQGVRRTIKVTLPGGVRHYDLLIQPRRDDQGRIIGVGGAALDVTSQKLVEEALKQADRQKDEFVAMLAHELRNPLAAIHYANEAARLGAANEDEVVATIERQVQQLMHLVDDLLDVSRITRGKIQLKQDTVDAAAVVERAVATVRPLIDRHQHDLAVDVSYEPMALCGDAARLEQIFVNLLTNAAKYTPDGGKIHFAASPQHGEVVFRVRDSGIGIPEHMLSRVFDLFSQAERSLDRADGGLGIGLTVVQSLVEMHGGTVHAASGGVGCGSEFIVHLPMAKTPAGLAASEAKTGA